MTSHRQAMSGWESSHRRLAHCIRLHGELSPLIGSPPLMVSPQIMSLPPMQRFGKYMVIWALGIWLGSVLNFTGFIMGQARVPYIVIDASNNATSVKFDYRKLASCDADAYCWPDELMDRYHVSPWHLCMPVSCCARVLDAISTVVWVRRACWPLLSSA